MAAQQKRSPRQPPKAEQPAANSGASPDTQGASSAPASSPSTDQQPVGGADQQGAPGSELSFNELLQQQIAQAIQPVLNEFRQQVTQTMEEELQAVPSPVSGERPAAQPQQQAPGASQPAEQPQQQAAPTESPAAQSQQQAAPPSPADQPQQQAAPPSTADQPQQQSLTGTLTHAAQAVPSQVTQVVESGGKAAEQAAGQAKQAARPAVSGALRPVLNTVEHQGAQWLQSLLVAGLTALLAESTRAAVEHRADQGLHLLLQKAFDALPEEASSQELRNRTEGTLRDILHESLGAVFAEGIRTTLQQNGTQALQESLHGDFKGVLGQVQDTLKAMLDALLAVLRRQRQRLVRLLLALVLVSLESSLAASEKGK